MGKIRILPDAIANKIAAGEVVERPAAAVKELVENALDAGATRLRVDVEAGGKRFIRVVDDGCGMGHDDALLAFERHATSKLRQAEDLFSVATLGFRGEALPSLAAVSRLVLETRAAEEATGTRVEVNGGRIQDVKEAGLPTGTSVTLRDLFYNVPARRKFLRAEATEMSHVAAIVTHYSLAHPERGFVLSSSTGELLNVSPVGSLRERFFQVFGGEILEQMVDLGELSTEFPIFQSGSASHVSGFTPAYGSQPPSSPAAEGHPSTACVRLTGFISRPQVQKQNRNSIYIFVNGRLIRDRLLLHALGEAYRNVIPPGTFPVALLFLAMPYEEVDVNVHPSKTEVRFRHQSIVHDFLREMVRQRLNESRPVSSFPVVAPPEIRHPVPVISQQAATAAAFELSAPRPLPEPGRLTFGPLAIGEPPAAPVFATAPEPSAQPMSLANLEWESLRPLGQLQESFIVAASPDGLWIIDQHVAHERVLFEQVLRRRAENQRLEGQQLLMPYILRLSPAQQACFEDIRGELEANGFEIEPFGHSTVAIKAAPAGVPAAEIEKLLQEVLDQSDQRGETPLTGRDELRRKVAASVACHAAIKVNMALDQRKMEWLLGALAGTESPMTCPHGRPVVLKYSMREILKAFHRI